MKVVPCTPTKALTQDHMLLVLGFVVYTYALSSIILSFLSECSSELLIPAKIDNRGYSWENSSLAFITSHALSSNLAIVWSSSLYSMLTNRTGKSVATISLNFCLEISLSLFLILQQENPERSWSNAFVYMDLIRSIPPLTQKTKLNAGKCLKKALKTCRITFAAT